MSGGIPIRFRRTVKDTPVDTPNLAEPLVHILDRKFGFYDGTNMLWYPGLDPVTNLMRMNQGQSITGRDTNGDAKIKISFDVPNTLQIVEIATNTVLASFSAAGATFNNLAASPQLAGGSLNRGSHPGFIPQLFSATAVSTTTGSQWVGPNTYLWKRGGATGDLSVRYENFPGAGAVSHPSVDTYALRLEVTAPTNGVGLRTWLFDPALGFVTTGTNNNRVYLSIIGTAGQTCEIRVGRAGSYTTQVVTGTDNWQRIGIDIPAHAQSTSYINGGTNEPFAVDLAHNVSGGVWRISEPTVQTTDTLPSEVFQYRSLGERMDLAASYYWEPHGINVTGTSAEAVSLPVRLPIYTLGIADYDVQIISADFPVTITNKTALGFDAATATANTDRWTFKPRIAYRGSLVDIL